jgi:hypothetical protein
MSPAPKISLRPASLAFWAACLFAAEAPAWAQLNSTSPGTLNNTTSSVIGPGNTTCGASVAGCSGLAAPNVNTPSGASGSTAAGVGSQPPGSLAPNGSAGTVGTFSAPANSGENFAAPIGSSEGFAAPGSAGSLPGNSAGQVAPGSIGAPPTTGLNTNPGMSGVGVGTTGAGAPSYGGLGAYSSGAPATGSALPGTTSAPGTVTTPLTTNPGIGGAGSMARSAGR